MKRSPKYRRVSWGRRATRVQHFCRQVSLERRPGECWLWTGAISDNGYGAFSVGKRYMGAHRFSYEIFIGPIPEGLHIDHLCRVRHCVNPQHLEAVDIRTNLIRAPTTWAGQNSRKTHCPKGHAFTDKNTYIYEGSRSCRMCRTKEGKLHRRIG